MNMLISLRPSLCFAVAFAWLAVASTGELCGQEEQEPAATPSTTKELMQAAYEKTKTAETVGDYTEVINLCERALDEDPSEKARGYLMRLSAWAYNRRGKQHSLQATRSDDSQRAVELEAEALADFEKAVQRDPTKWQALHNRGVSYALIGEYSKAMSDFNRTIEINPRYPNVWFNRGEINYQRGQHSAALGDYTQAIRLDPEDAGAYNARAHAYYQLGRLRSALSDYSRAVSLAPDKPRLVADRADIYAHLGDWQRANRDYRTAMRLDENLARAWMGAAWVMATCPEQRYRDADQAVEYARKAVALHGEDDWRYQDTLAAAFANAGRFDDAQRAIAQAVRLAPQDQTEDLKSRQQLYANGEPYRDQPRSRRGLR